jgi:hypothetical protein
MLCLLAAIHDGLPNLARIMFSPANAGQPISLVTSAPEVPEPERAILQEWLDAPDRRAWQHVAAGSLGDRLELVRRVGFDPPE